MSVVALAAAAPALAAEPVAPPALYAPDTWEGRSAAVVRVLDRLDAHLELLTVPVGHSAAYKTLTVAVDRCLQHPPGLPSDAAASLRISDGRTAGTAFEGWMFAAEPALAVFESPVFGVQLVSCGGAEAPPAAPPPPVASAAALLPPAVPASPDEPNAVYPSGAPDGPDPGAQSGMATPPVPPDAAPPPTPPPGQ